MSSPTTDSCEAVETAYDKLTAKHESQSLFWERHIGLSKSFWEFATPRLQAEFENFEYAPQEIYEAVNAVSPSLIRVEADELTYPLHVILRYRLETGVIEGDLDVSDIPRVWKEEMKSLLNVSVPSDAQGCLQDVHWSAFAFGYFPTYLIGAATAAQLEHYCRKEFPDLDERIEQGEFQEIKAWLTDKIHRHGKRYPSLDAMLEDQLGEPLSPKYFIDYLTEKYTDIYKLE
jgi:carboxypeptidase Taq